MGSSCKQLPAQQPPLSPWMVAVSGPTAREDAAGVHIVTALSGAPHSLSTDSADGAGTRSTVGREGTVAGSSADGEEARNLEDKLARARAALAEVELLLARCDEAGVGIT